MIRELALFTGVGGGLLGTHQVGWSPVCAVEHSAHCQAVLVQRMRDGLLPEFPIWGDVATFDGYPWRGRVDVVSGGFPCQPFSSASRGRRVAADRWPDMLRIVSEAQPPAVFAENVQRKPIMRAARDLADRGYRVEVAQASTASVAGTHDRPRWWALAYADDQSKRVFAEHAEMARASAPSPGFWDAPPAPGILGVDDGVASRVERHRAIGNGQCPQVVERVLRHFLLDA